MPCRSIEEFLNVGCCFFFFTKMQVADSLKDYLCAEVVCVMLVSERSRKRERRRQWVYVEYELNGNVISMNAAAQCVYSPGCLSVNKYSFLSWAQCCNRRIIDHQTCVLAYYYSHANDDWFVIFDLQPMKSLVTRNQLNGLLRTQDFTWLTVSEVPLQTI